MRNGGTHEKAQRQARIQEYTQRQAQIVAKAGKKWRTGRQEKAEKHAKIEAKGRFKKRKGRNANNGAQAGEIRSKGRLENKGTSPDKCQRSSLGYLTRT